MNRRLLFGWAITVIELSLPGLVRAADSHVENLERASAIHCAIQDGAGAVWDAKQLSLKSGDWGSDRSLNFLAIDLANGNATATGNQRPTMVRAWKTGIGIHFVEVTGFGNVMMSTVFFSGYSQGFYKVVTSRHVDVFGAPIPSQYY